ncbi:hypothetical protein NKH77_36885 [Streptomyces sp. M19]
MIIRLSRPLIGAPSRSTTTSPTGNWTSTSTDSAPRRPTPAPGWAARRSTRPRSSGSGSA